MRCRACWTTTAKFGRLPGVKIILLSDQALTEAIKVATYNLQHPEKFLQRWQQNPKWLQAVIETQTLHLSLLMEVQHRRHLHGPLGVAGFDIEVLSG